MRFYISFLCFFLFGQTIFAQGDSIVLSPDFLSKMQELEIAKFDNSRSSKYIHYFPMKYARFIFNDKDKEWLTSISDTIVERIDLVYTVFRRDKKFDQVKLNRERFEMLKTFFPSAFNNNLIEWNLVAQDGAENYEVAREYFHGFVIYLKPHRVTTKDGKVISTVMDRRVDEPESKVLETNDEIAKVKRTIEEVAGGSKITKIVKDTITKWEQQKTASGYYIPADPKKRGKNRRYTSNAKDRVPEYYMKKVKKTEVVEKEILVDGGPPTKESIETGIAKITDDKVVYDVYKKNMEKWKDCVIVQDVTGSMYPYLTQTLLYLRANMNNKDTEKFVFFNDGDHAPDGVLGRTGGCYYVSSASPQEIEEMAYEAMRKGQGGKAPENDIEALLYAVTKFPKCQGLVLIADNFSRVRDISLIERLIKTGKKVDVVICGLGKGGVVNLDYLYIAQLTGGSIHTIEGDYNDLASKKNGDVFKVGSQHFQMESKTIKLIKQDK